MMSVPRLYSVGDRIINEYGAVGGMTIGIEALRKNQPQYHFVQSQIPHELESNPDRTGDY
jgi:hypothetical protein